MKTKVKRLLIALMAAVCFHSSIGLAQWTNDPANPRRVSNLNNDQTFPSVIDDGSGGMIVFWRVNPVSSNFFSIHAQHISADGSLLNGSDGTIVLTRPGRNIGEFSVAKAPGGEILMVWNEGVSIFMDTIRCQRLNPLSLQPMGPLKTVAGNTASLSILGFGATQILATNTHFFVAYDVTYFGGAVGVYIQKVDLNGNPLIALNNNIGQRMEGCIQCYGPFQIVEGPMKGIMLIQRDGNGGGAGLRAYRMNGNGSMVFANKVITAGTAGLGYAFHCLADGKGGVVFSWVEAGGDVYISRIDSLGNLAWTPNHVLACTNLSIQDNPYVASEGPHFYVTFSDNRPPISMAQTFIQKVNMDGNVLFNPKGRPLIPGANGYGIMPRLIPMGDGSLIATSSHSGRGFLAQRLLADSSLAWPDTGSLIATSAVWPWNERYKMVKGSQGNILLAWQTPNPQNKVYVTKLGSNGQLVENRKVISSQSIQVWPNPFSGAFCLKSDPETMKVELYNSQGQRVFVKFSNTENGQCVDAPALPPGMYRLLVQGKNGQTKTMTIAKQ